MAFDDLNELRSVDELLDHQKNLKSELNDLNTEYSGLPFPEAAREKFAELKEANDEIDRRVVEFKAREKVLASLAGNERNLDRPPADDVFRGREKDEKSERAIYDLSGIRIDPSNPERARDEFRDRAMRAVEHARFPQSGMTRESCQDHVAGLLERDTRDGQFAQLILRTGSPTYRRALSKYVSGAPLTSDETRAVSETRAFSLGSTGIPIPYILDPTVIPVSSSVVNPLRAISSVEQIVGANEWRGVTAAAITAARASEATEASDNTPTLAQPTIVCSKVQAFVPFSIESDQDWTGMDAALGRLFADAKDDEEATAFNSGNGTPPNPFGVFTGATGTTAASSGLTITAANLYSLEGALAPRFRPRAQFVANRAMYNIIRALDTAGGAQLWLRIGELLPNNPASDGGLGNTGLRLLGYPVNELSTAPATVTNGVKIMLLGDFSMFKIIDRVGMSVEVIPHLFGATSRFPTGQRGLYAYWRNGSKVIDAVGFRALTGTT